jgi:hypothetical protein
MRKMLREDDIEDLLEQVSDGHGAKEPAAEKVAKTPASPADKALELQKAAGNKAVGAAIDRFNTPFLPSNAPAVAAWPKRPEARFGDDLVVPIESAQDPKNDRGGPGRLEEREQESGPGELVITTPAGDFVVDLHKAVVHSRHFDKVVIVLPHGAGGIVITLHDVYVSAGHLSGRGHSWQLSYGKRKFSNAPPD